MNAKDILMYYHTSLRNIGLFTSVSLGMLAYSRFYRGKSKLYNIAFILISLLFLSLVLYLTVLFVETLQLFKSKTTKDSSEEIQLRKLIQIPQALIVLNSVVFLFGTYSLYREISS